MLSRLHIQNYAIIDDLAVDFSDHLNIITGETGAGKSIIMGALGLILGERADSSVLQQKDKKCVVEGCFNSDHKKTVKQFLADNDLDADEELVIRREIAVNGKSRAFINDTPVNVTQLKALSSLLVDLHQQFDTLELGDADFQREVLDALADNTTVLQNYTTHYNEYLHTKKELQDLQARQAAANTTYDYNKFLFDELEEAKLKENELEELDAELKLLSNAENIKQQISGVTYELNESDLPIVQQLKALVNRLHSLEKFHPAIEGLNKRLLSTQIELKDIADELEQINDSVQYSAERIQEVNDRIALGYKLLKKHNVTGTAELLIIMDQLQQKLNDVLNIGEAIAAKEKQTEQLLQQCMQLAKTLSANRNKAIKPFTEKVNTLLKQVGMPNAQVKIECVATELNTFGCDAISFLFDANKSNRFEPLHKVASGGELSRLMLCIKSLVAQKLQLPTLIFDEIDTGISGEAAKQVGNIMKELAKEHQIISITHQPQIAAKAHAHYFVYKAIKGDAIITSVKLLNNDERITAIAQMLSGEKPTAAALQNAREMVGN
ncbi:MAG: DNA repair protein RecN [Bacteroidetes bacterium]|nr:DNA repair protein RecN [Bacteroidota bacterium]